MRSSTPDVSDRRDDPDLSPKGPTEDETLDRAELLELVARERRRADEATRLKDEFLATLNHELRTPLTAVLGWISLLRQADLPSSKRQRALESIERNARAEARLVDNLLDVSRLATGRLAIDAAPVELAPVIESALEAVRAPAEAKEIEILHDLDPAAGRVLGDADRLRQVAWHLLGNAVKFTPRGGRIEVRLALAGASAELSIKDTGEGIRADFLPHVFERFRQADASTTRAHGGLGIGLTIAHRLVELHGGTIRAQSEGEGRGATFTVRLPFHALSSSGQVPRVPARGAAIPELRGVRVLVVDDEPDSLALIASVLELSDAEVQTADSAGEALALFRRRAPDVLLSDVGMPGEDGLSLIRAIRALPADEGGRVPAAALTAYAGAAERRQALGAGFDLHLAKPVDPTELLAMVAHMAVRGAPR